MANFLEKEATQFNQTTRTGYILKMTPDELIQVLPARQAEQLTLFTDTNRPIKQQHLGAIERFLEETPDWAMPAIVLSARPGVIRPKARKISIEAGDLEIIDGQHRLQAFSNLLHEWEMDAPREETGETGRKLEEFRKQDLPVVIFEVTSNIEHRQMFAWFARNRPIEPAVREFFDQSDPFGKVAKEAMNHSQMLQDHVTWKVRTLPQRGEEAANLLTLNNLKEIVTTIRIGIRRGPRPADQGAVLGPRHAERTAGADGGVLRPVPGVLQAKLQRPGQPQRTGQKHPGRPERQLRLSPPSYPACSQRLDPLALRPRNGA